MKVTSSKRETVLVVEQSGPLDAACEAFEAALKVGDRPEIEQFLPGYEEPELSKLLFELLRLEIQYFSVQVQSQGEYLTRFPDHCHVINEVFASTVAPPPPEETLIASSALRLRWCLGQGGLGIVYVAEDEQLRRETAVKFIQDNLRHSEASKEQFRLEAEITGRLEHPGIVPVYGLGQMPDGRQFYVMRLIRGERYDAAIAKYYQSEGERSKDSVQRQVDFHELLQRFAAVCKTLAYAHNRGVIHRDLKPGNIMLGRYGETMVIDWGLGAHVGRQGVFKDSSERTLMPESSTASTLNSRGGTPSYMSPEQAAGRDILGPPSDIYSLGATLYTIITGQVPFVGTHADVLARVARGEFPRPREVRPKTSKALEAICLKAMSLDPQRRYPTALKLAEDVERFLADATVSAYEEPRARRIARWARRHRTVTESGLVALLLLGVIGSVAAVWMGRQAQQERELRTEADTARMSETSLRTHGLQLTAAFAARTIANQVDLRWRILEKEAADEKIHALLETANAAPANEAGNVPLQQWLDARLEQDYSTLPCRAWSIYSSDGTQVARSPILNEKGEKARSVGQNFAYRDYFHGEGEDYTAKKRAATKPLTEPHISTAFRSVVDGRLVITLSVPIRARNNADPLGVMTMTVELGGFADLKLPLSPGQVVMLVDSRQYYMLPSASSDGNELKGERGDGLVLHHRDLASVLNKSPLPHVDDNTIHFVREAMSHWQDQQVQGSALNNLLPETYRDPLASDSENRRVAAFAPVFVDNRPAQQRETGWFVIVQQ